jgi:hypothetical protein
MEGHGLSSRLGVMVPARLAKMDSECRVMANSFELHRAAGHSSSQLFFGWRRSVILDSQTRIRTSQVRLFSSAAERPPCGYDSLSAFIRTFHLNIGTIPAEHRRMMSDEARVIEKGRDIMSRMR